MNYKIFLKSKIAQAILCASILPFSATIDADELSDPPFTYSQSDFGGVGLMQMPTARMMPDGGLAGGITDNDDYTHYTASLQLFSWLETTVRYTQVHHMLYSNDSGFSGGTDYTDKSFDAKLKLLNESYWLPQVAVGARDIGGTGLFDGEFVAASKRYHNFDFTLGVGWGYIGNSGNISGSKSVSEDCGRNTTYTRQAGSINASRMFTGCTALFGGVEYQTPYQPLKLKAEYDGNDYQSDFPVTSGNSSMAQSTPWNFGLVYSLADWAALRVSYERGNTLTAGITLQTNLATLRPQWIDTPPPTYQPKPKQDDLTPAEWKTLNKEIEKVAGYSHTTLYQSKDSVTLKGKPTKYRNLDDSHQRASYLIANTGIKAEKINIIDANENLPLTETAIDSNALKRVGNNDYLNAKFDDTNVTENPKPISGDLKADSKDAWQFGFAPVLQQSFGGAEDFYLYAIGVNANSSYRFGDNWTLSSTVYGNIIDNYDKFNYTVPPDGTSLKRVRTLSRQYYDDPVRIDNLQLTHFDRYGSGLYSQVYGGYLESMFAGAGTEWLYRPLHNNWAIGTDVNYVVQREPGTALGVFSSERHYDSETGRYYNVQTGIATGNATLYWQPKFWRAIDHTLLKVSAGRYLAGDNGVTVDFSKQFDSGIIAGAFVTKTNLSAADYGEGSFTKGFYISIPLDLITVRPSRERANISWLPLQRDGGQMLNRKYSLYDITDARSPWYTRPVIN